MLEVLILDPYTLWVDLVLESKYLCGVLANGNGAEGVVGQHNCLGTVHVHEGLHTLVKLTLGGSTDLRLGRRWGRLVKETASVKNLGA